jgi:hypothetical protein
MWVATTDFPTAASHPFYTRLNQVLRDTGESYEEFLTKLAKALSQQPIPRRSGSGGRPQLHLRTGSGTTELEEEPGRARRGVSQSAAHPQLIALGPTSE